MYSDLKHFIKSALYFFQPKVVLSEYPVNLGYIFHTEKIHDDSLFRQLVEFCIQFRRMTGAQPICTIIPPTNLLLKQELLEARFTEDQFVNRLQELSEVATLGYHGHFYLNSDPDYINAIHCHSFNRNNLDSQFNRDIEWFASNGISTNRIYAGGWWFINKELVQLLADSGFEFDFTSSRLKYYYNHYSTMVMNRGNIEAGESFYLDTRNGRMILCIQNFITCHDSPFPQDFVRNMKSLLSPNSDKMAVTGVVNSHDYDLQFDNTIRCVDYLLKNTSVVFHSFPELVNLLKENNRPFKIIPYDVHNKQSPEVS